MDFEGLEVNLPGKLPTSFSYRFAKITRLEEKGENSSGEVYALLVNVIGDAQYDAICEHVDTIRKDVGLVDFLVRLLDAYQVDEGESQASVKP